MIWNLPFRITFLSKNNLQVHHLVRLQKTCYTSKKKVGTGLLEEKKYSNETRYKKKHGSMEPENQFLGKKEIPILETIKFNDMVNLSLLNVHSKTQGFFFLWPYHKGLRYIS